MQGLPKSIEQAASLQSSHPFNLIILVDSSNENIISMSVDGGFDGDDLPRQLVHLDYELSSMRELYRKSACHVYDIKSGGGVLAARELAFVFKNTLEDYEKVCPNDVIGVHNIGKSQNDRPIINYYNGYVWGYSRGC